jgi:hypothetical protein
MMDLYVNVWEPFVIANKQQSTVASLWDGENLKYTLKRCVSESLMRVWEIVQIASTIIFLKKML